MIVSRSLYILLSAILVVAGTGCGSQPSTNVTLAAPTIQQEPTSTACIGIPEIPNPLIQAENETIEEFVARIVASDISHSRPALIALTQVKSKKRLSEGISTNRWDVQQCWFYETDSERICSNEDMTIYFNDQITSKIFFAPAYSDSTGFLFLIEQIYYWDGNKSTEWYRLVLEREDGTWIEKSILPYFW